MRIVSIGVSTLQLLGTSVRAPGETLRDVAAGPQTFSGYVMNDKCTEREYV